MPFLTNNCHYLFDLAQAEATLAVLTVPIPIKYPKSMSKHNLFICQSCDRSSEDRPKDQPTDGTRLLEQLNTLGTEHIQSNEFEIQPVGCLWTCDKPCAAAFSALHKPTYLFTSLPTDETAPALLEFGQRYRHSNTGDIPWKQFPAVLQSASVAKIPAVR